MCTFEKYGRKLCSSNQYLKKKTNVLQSDSPDIGKIRYKPRVQNTKIFVKVSIKTFTVKWKTVWGLICWGLKPLRN